LQVAQAVQTVAVAAAEQVLLAQAEQGALAVQVHQVLFLVLR
jgi:hypothetical protein